jgi:hypothetical protein
MNAAGNGATRPVHGIAAARLRLLFAIALLAAWTMMSPARAQAVAMAAGGTGDAWVDATLADMDRYAARYPDAFVDELTRYQAAPRSLVANLVGPGHWAAGDVYFACALARVAAQPCRTVAAMRAQDQDWSALEQRLGLGPDSVQFHRLKRGIVSSYARWARPLRVDASLHAEFPNLPLQPEQTPPAGAAGASDHAPVRRGHRAR